VTSPLATKRVLLRPYRADDRARFVALMTNAEVMRHVGGTMPPDKADHLFDAHIRVGQPYERLFCAWAAELSDSREYVGGASLLRNTDEDALEIGYLLMPRFWGRGLATEIARLVLAHAHRELDLVRVIATVDLDNAASIRVIEKSGMTLARRARDDDGEYLLYESLRP
jgi:ribosomal-protein-alanine N-acetyltransferase